MKKFKNRFLRNLDIDNGSLMVDKIFSCLYMDYLEYYTELF